MVVRPSLSPCTEVKFTGNNRVPSPHPLQSEDCKPGFFALNAVMLHSILSTIRRSSTRYERLRDDETELRHINPNKVVVVRNVEFSRSFLRAVPWGFIKDGADHCICTKSSSSWDNICTHIIKDTFLSSSASIKDFSHGSCRMIKVELLPDG